MAERRERTARDAWHRVLWDPRLDAAAFDVEYVDRHAAGGTSRKPLEQWDEEVPWHRVQSIQCGRYVFWHRDAERESTGEMPPQAFSRAPEEDFEPVSVHLIGARQHFAVGEKLRIATLNVLFGADQERLDLLVSAIRSWDADIVALQEVTPELMARLWQAFAGWHVSEPAHGPSLHPHGVVLLSRHPFTLSARRLTAHKRVLSGRWTIGGRALRVATMHLPSDRMESAAELRLAYLAGVATWLEQSGEDAVIAGDLNARHLALANFRDAGAGVTYDPRDNPLAARTTISGQPAAFDRVLTRLSAWEVGEVSLQTTCEGRYFSDHYAIVADLRAAPDLPRERVHRSALCIIPPHSAWAEIQAIRRRHDRQVKRWMPHVNLLYGFVPEEQFGDAVPRVEEALRGLQPFDVELSDYGFFQHRREVTAWLDPVAPELERLQARLQAVFPHCDEQNRGGEFTPHLSVGKFSSEAEALDALPDWAPLRFTVDHVALISRRGDEPFEVRHRVPLGGLQAVVDRLEPHPDHAAREAAEAVVRRACPDVQQIGSARLGTESVHSDLDLFCGSRDLSELQNALGGEIAEARVPVLRVKLHGVAVEIQCGAPDALEDADEISRHVDDWDAFRGLLRCIRAWTRARRIHGQAWGFPGTFAWTILAAWSNPAGDIADCFTRLLSKLHRHDWSRPVALQRNPDFQRRKRDHMPVLTPRNHNCTDAMTASTARVLREEVERALSLAERRDWLAVLEPPVPVGSLVTMPREALHGRFLARMIELEAHGAWVRPWPSHEGDAKMYVLEAGRK